MHNVTWDCANFQGLDNCFDFTGQSLQSICNGIFNPILVWVVFFLLSVCKLSQVLYSHLGLDIGEVVLMIKSTLHIVFVVMMLTNILVSG